MVTHIPSGVVEHGRVADGTRSSAPMRVSAARRRRRVPYLLVGVLLVVGCATGGVVAALHLGHRIAVLALDRPVAVGQQLMARDLREVDISSDTGLAPIPAGAREHTIGRAVGYTLPAGTLLTKDLLVSGHIPPAGQGVAAVSLKTAQVPAGLEAGMRVTVVETPPDDAVSAASTGTPTGAAAAEWNAVVLAVRNDSTDQTVTASLQMAQGDAKQVAAAPSGQLGLVVMHGGAR
jgi:hypothetical protein